MFVFIIVPLTLMNLFILVMFMIFSFQIYSKGNLVGIGEEKHKTGIIKMTSSLLFFKKLTISPNHRNIDLKSIN